MHYLGHFLGIVAAIASLLFIGLALLEATLGPMMAAAWTGNWWLLGLWPLTLAGFLTGLKIVDDIWDRR